MTYIHPHHEKIRELIRNHIPHRENLQRICTDLFHWFDENIAYSRLNAPFFPLQRSDLDVLSMHSGTCGDYANLLVSVFQTLGYEAGYAYVHRDCYGDAQDHICAAVRDGGQWILVDATQPYRKWYGYHCPHLEYELLLPDDFEEKMKREEAHWTAVANQWGTEALAGLLYAPWVHEEILAESEHSLESVFFLLSMETGRCLLLYAYHKIYTKDRGCLLCMSRISKETQTYCFSRKKPDSLWDDGQWSRAYPKSEVPTAWTTEAFDGFQDCIRRVLPDIQNICKHLELPLLNP